MKLQPQLPLVAQRASQASQAAKSADQGAQEPKETQDSVDNHQVSFEEFYAPQRRKELMLAAVPLVGAYHNISKAATNLLGFGTGGGLRVGAALCNLAGTAALVTGRFPLGLAGLAASSGLTYLHQRH